MDGKDQMFLSIYECMPSIMAVTYIGTENSAKPIIKSMKQNYRSNPWMVVGNDLVNMFVCASNHGPTPYRD